MKKFITRIFYNSLLLIITIQTNFCFASTNKDPVVAQYNKIKVKKSDVINSYNIIVRKKDKINDDQFDLLSKDQQSEIIMNHVRKKIIEKEAKESKIITRPEYSLDYNNKHNAIISDIFLNSKLKPFITKEILQEEFSSLLQNMKLKGQCEIQYVFFKTLKEAEDNLKKIVSKQKTFDNLLKTNDKKKNSTIIQPGMINSSIEKIIFSLKIDQISKPLYIEDVGCYMLVKLISKKPIKNSELPTFSERKQSIKKDIKTKNTKKIIENIVSKYNVKLFFDIREK